MVLYIIEFFLTIEKELIKKQFAIVFLSNKILNCNLLFIGQYEYASTLKVVILLFLATILLILKRKIVKPVWIFLYWIQQFLIIWFEISIFNFFILISFIKILEANKGILITFEVVYFILNPSIKLFGTQIDSIPLLISKCFKKISSVVITSFIIK